MQQAGRCFLNVLRNIGESLFKRGNDRFPNLRRNGFMKLSINIVYLFMLSVEDFHRIDRYT